MAQIFSLLTLRTESGRRKIDVMANLRHPNFILAILSVVVLLLGIGFRANGENSVGDVLLIIAIVMGGIHWVWSIIDVAKTDTLLGSQKKFWLIGVIAIPLGGMLYYILHSKRNTIVD
jgi:hypothetical protein